MDIGVELLPVSAEPIRAGEGVLDARVRVPFYDLIHNRNLAQQRMFLIKAFSFRGQMMRDTMYIWKQKVVA